eukprot:SAG25_NODE_336_length_9546_cov_18.211390_5_plen_140_part_00
MRRRTQKWRQDRLPGQRRCTFQRYVFSVYAILWYCLSRAINNTGVGDLGYPHSGFPKWLSDFVLRGKEPIRKGAIDEGGWWYRVDDPSHKLPDLDFDAKTAEVNSWWPTEDLGREATEEDVRSYSGTLPVQHGLFALRR